MLSLKIIIASTRPGRKGPSMAQWMFDVASKQEDWSVEMLDLAEINLPMMDEPHHPRFKKYEHDHTKKWSAMIEHGDAYIIVTPEYNYGFPATIKNALDYLYQEWNCKPVAFVSYGGVSAGTRAVQMLKQVVTAQKMMPMAEGVAIPFFTKFMDDEGKFTGDKGLEDSANTMLMELKKWSVALKAMR